MIVIMVLIVNKNNNIERVRAPKSTKHVKPIVSKYKNKYDYKLIYFTEEGLGTVIFKKIQHLVYQKNPACVSMRENNNDR